MRTELRMRPNELKPSIAGGTATRRPAETRPTAAGRFAAAPAELQLSIVVPTFNERQNVQELIARLELALRGIAWELIFVDDDSPDGTSAEVKAIAARDSRIRCLRRIGRRGLSSACIEGMLAAAAPTLVVMDADLQHDETLLVSMLDRLRRGDADLVVASRFLDTGAADGLDRWRAQLSRLANGIARTALDIDLSDPMSGFFMMRRQAFEELAPSLSSDGFKILFDIVASAHGRLRIAELPFVFRARAHGESKLDARIAVDYVALVVSKLTSDVVSFRFLLFCLVGLTGVGIHMAILQMALGFGGARFAVAQTIATVGAICWNFVLNNMVTYRDQRLSGWPFVSGLLRFQIVCGIGAISNVGIASLMYGQGAQWWLAGLTGAVMGAVWNYMVSAVWVWRRH